MKEQLASLTKELEGVRCQLRERSLTEEPETAAVAEELPAVVGRGAGVRQEPPLLEREDGEARKHTLCVNP